VDAEADQGTGVVGPVAAGHLVSQRPVNAYGLFENIFRDSKHGAALQHLLSGYEQVNTSWMWASLITAAIAAWLHQLTGLILGGELAEGHVVRGGKAIIATLRRRLIAVPARLVRHGGQLIIRLAPGDQLLPDILSAIGASPASAS
jgi:hypothetical protein